MRTTLESIKQEVISEIEIEEQRVKVSKEYFQDIMLPLFKKHEELLGEGFSYDELKKVNEGFYKRACYIGSTKIFVLVYYFGNGQHKIMIENEYIDIVNNSFYFNNELLQTTSKTYILDIPQIKKHIKEILKEQLKCKEENYIPNL